MPNLIPVGVLMSLARISSTTLSLVFFGVSSTSFGITAILIHTSTHKRSARFFLKEFFFKINHTLACRLLLVLVVTGVFPLLLTGFSTTGAGSGSGAAMSSGKQDTINSETGNWF